MYSWQESHCMSKVRFLFNLIIFYASTDEKRKKLYKMPFCFNTSYAMKNLCKMYFWLCVIYFYSRATLFLLCFIRQLSREADF